MELNKRPVHFVGEFVQCYIGKLKLIHLMYKPTLKKEKKKSEANQLRNEEIDFWSYRVHRRHQLRRSRVQFRGALKQMLT